MILQGGHVTKQFSGEEVLRDINFMVNEGEKWVLLGRNGSGKSTLFKILSGEMEADGGTIVLKKGAVLAHLPQFTGNEEDKKVIDYVSEAFHEEKKMEDRIAVLEKEMEGTDEKAVMKAVEEFTELLEVYQSSGAERSGVRITDQLKKLGFSEAEMNRPIRELSGGQKQKVILARIALTKADILLIDEPTNHLDLAAIRWLEDFLVAFPGALIAVSHDAAFVERIADRIMHLSHGKVELFHMGYADYLIESEARNVQLRKQITEQEEMIKKNKSYIAKFGAGTRSAQAQSRLKMLDRIELLEAPIPESQMRGLNFPIDEELPREVLKVRHLHFARGDNKIITDVSLDLFKNERIALIGRNGAGKSTFIKLLMEQLVPDSGTIRFGARIVPTYFDQEQGNLDPSKTILDFFTDRYQKLGLEELRTKLGTFLFPGDAVFDPIRVLSGGERSRLQILDLLLQKPNFLILDEPTNHLDIASISILSKSLKSYEGALLLVSHDRNLIDSVANRLWVLANGKVHSLAGGYSENREALKELLGFEMGTDSEAKPVLVVNETFPRAESASGVAVEVKRPPKKKPNAFKVREVESQIEKLEAEKDLLENELVGLKPGELSRIPALKERLTTLETELKDRVSEWETIHGA